MSSFIHEENNIQEEDESLEHVRIGHLSLVFEILIYFLLSFRILVSLDKIRVACLYEYLLLVILKKLSYIPVWTSFETAWGTWFLSKQSLTPF